MNTIDAIWEMNAAHHKELLQAAQARRSSVKTHALPLQSLARIFQLAGDALIDLGLRMKARYTPRVHKVV